jgi:hypothetical protein
MRYIENTTLFNLHNINYDALVNKIQSSKKNIRINLDRLIPFLKIVQDESMIVNKVDFPIQFTFNVSASHEREVTITFSQKTILLPHIINSKADVFLYMTQSAFNDPLLVPEIMFEKMFNNSAKNRSSTEIYSDIYTMEILKILKKIDKLLICNGELVAAVYKQKIYPDIKEIIGDIFNTVISKRELNVSSKVKMKKGYRNSIFSISLTTTSYDNFDNMIISISIYSQELKLTHSEFMEASNTDIENALVAILKLKNINIKDIENLKNELILQEMINI